MKETSFRLKKQNQSISETEKAQIRYILKKKKCTGRNQMDAPNRNCFTVQIPIQIEILKTLLIPDGKLCKEYEQLQQAACMAGACALSEYFWP